MSWSDLISLPSYIEHANFWEKAWITCCSCPLSFLFLFGQFYIFMSTYYIYSWDTMSVTQRGSRHSKKSDNMPASFCWVCLSRVLVAEMGMDWQARVQLLWFLSFLFFFPPGLVDLIDAINSWSKRAEMRIQVWKPRRMNWLAAYAWSRSTEASLFVACHVCIRFFFSS